jgi:hypothetical protein
VAEVVKGLMAVQAEEEGQAASDLCPLRTVSILKLQAEYAIGHGYSWNAAKGSAFRLAKKTQLVCGQLTRQARYEGLTEHAQCMLAYHTLTLNCWVRRPHTWGFWGSCNAGGPQDLLVSILCGLPELQEACELRARLVGLPQFAGHFLPGQIWQATHEGKHPWGFCLTQIRESARWKRWICGKVETTCRTDSPINLSKPLPDFIMKVG